MVKRCIMIFPEFKNGDIIDKIRNKYDPLAKHVRPHITLVFPFVSNIEIEELRQHINDVTCEFKPFEIMLQGISPVNNFGKYLFLNIKKGKNEIIEIHKKLYTGVLKEYLPPWMKEGAYRPHMTVGAFCNDTELEIGAQETEIIQDSFITMANNISVEVIDENEDSIIELSIPLK